MTSVTSTTPPQRHHESLHRHATAIQAAFRGFCTRQRIVWRVRAQLDAFVATLPHVPPNAWLLSHAALLSLPSSSVHNRWLPPPIDRNDAAAVKRLRLPRFEDNLFGIVSVYPLPLSTPLALATAQSRAVADTTSRNNENHDTVTRDDDHAPFEPMKSLPTDATIDRSASRDDDRGFDKQEASTDNNTAVACCNHEPVVSAPQQTVDVIVTTQSRETIVRELEWAKRALHERRQYIRQHRRHSS